MQGVPLAIFLGPYRNLTTLTAATLSLHPQCQVLNHAAERLLADPKINFIRDHNPETFSRFLQAARTASEGGRRGDFGGSILHSHAFQDEKVQALYHRRYGTLSLKPDASCLVWKDSMRLQTLLMSSEGTFDQFCAAFPDVRFILPIRNPIASAVSNLRTGHGRFLGLSDGSSLPDAIKAFIDCIGTVLDARENQPERIFVFTQYDPRLAMLQRLERFLGLQEDPRWLQDAQEAMSVRPTGPYPDELVEFAHQALQTRLHRWPDVISRLEVERASEIHGFQ